MEDKPGLSRKQERRIENLIGGLEVPAQELLRQLSPEIEKGSYNSVIGIDASGRIPALVLSGVIKDRYAQLTYASPQILFVAGGVDVTAAELQEKQTKLAAHIGSLMQKGILRKDRKVLVVEDTTLTAASVRSLTDVLRKEGLPFDVAVFASLEKKERLEEMIGANVHSNFHFGDTSVTHKPDLSGVVKEHAELFSKRRESKQGNAVMIGARNETEELVEKLSLWYSNQINADPTSHKNLPSVANKDSHDL